MNEFAFTGSFTCFVVCRKLNKLFVFAAYSKLTQLLFVINSFQNGDLLHKVLYLIGLGCGITCAILWAIQTPYYKIKSKECKDEFSKASKAEQKHIF